MSSSFCDIPVILRKYPSYKVGITEVPTFKGINTLVQHGRGTNRYDNRQEGYFDRIRKNTGYCSRAAQREYSLVPPAAQQLRTGQGKVFPSETPLLKRSWWRGITSPLAVLFIAIVVMVALLFYGFGASATSQPSNTNTASSNASSTNMVTTTTTNTNTANAPNT